MNTSPLAGCLAAALLFQIASHAETEQTLTSDASPAIDSLFEKGRWEVTLNSGAMFSPFIAESGRPVVNYSMTALQFGRMLNSPSDDLCWRGNWEFAAELFGGNIFQGKGNYLAGTTLWLRYNFLPEEWKVKPFAQAGMGLVLTDVDRRLQGDNFNFNLEIGVGLRYLINERWSVNLEYRYQHISNANTSDRNIGINSQGPILGVSYYF